MTIAQSDSRISSGILKNKESAFSGFKENEKIKRQIRIFVRNFVRCWILFSIFFLIDPKDAGVAPGFAERTRGFFSL